MIPKRLFLVSLILLAAGVYLRVFPFDHQAVPLKKPLEMFPRIIDSWQGQDLRMDESALKMLKVSDYLQREYRREGEEVLVYVGYYASQTGGAEIHSPTHCLPGNGWVLISGRSRDLQLRDGETLQLMESVYEKDSGRELFLYCYKTKNNYSTNKYTLKAFNVINSLRYGNSSATFLRFSSPVSTNPLDSAKTIEAFMNAFFPLLEDFLPE